MTALSRVVAAAKCSAHPGGIQQTGPGLSVSCGESIGQLSSTVRVGLFFPDSCSAEYLDTTGLVLGGDYNVYRGNYARKNGTDFLDFGDNNTSHGDNYMPDQM